MHKISGDEEKKRYRLHGGSGKMLTAERQMHDDEKVCVCEAFSSVSVSSSLALAADAGS